MIEPEIAFADLSDNATLAETLLKYTFADVGTDMARLRVFFSRTGNLPPASPIRWTIPAPYGVEGASAASRSAFRSTAQPAVRSSGLASSISLWLMPPTQGTNTIAVGATRAM
jgi:hypothetical protein